MTIQTIRLQITLPANAAKRGVPEDLPPSWIAKTHGKEITFLGSPRKDGKDLVFRVNVGNAVVPNRIKIKGSAGRAGVFDAKVEVARLGVLRVIRDLRGLIALPALVSPGDQVVVEVLSPKTTPPGGIWSFSGVQAQEAPDSSLPGEGNPRLSFTFPATLAPGERIEVVHDVRDHGLLPLEEAVRKMTHLPASWLGLEKRGLIKEGYHADLVVLEPQSVADRSTYDAPRAYPEGIPHVFINGRLAAEDGKVLGGSHGRVLRCGRDLG